MDKSKQKPLFLAAVVSLGVAIFCYVLARYTEPLEPNQQYKEAGILADGSHAESHVPSTMDRVRMAIRIMPGEITEANIIVMD
jgi:hypothetical protein